MGNITLFEALKGCELRDEKIIVKVGITNLLKVAKELYSFDVLKQIIADNLSNDEVELKYNLYSTDEKEECFITIIVKHRAESISAIYNNASNFEKNIGDMSGIKFY